MTETNEMNNAAFTTPSETTDRNAATRDSGAAAPTQGSPDYTFDLGQSLTFGDLEVTSPVDPELLAKMKYMLDMTLSNTPLRHRLHCADPIESHAEASAITVRLKSRGVIIHTGNDHAPIWYAPGVYQFWNVVEYDPFTERMEFAFD